MIYNFNRYFFMTVALVSVTTAFLLAWGSWNDNEDLFMALCAGRDVLNGNLATPDTWAYTTNGEIWVNQGWLSCLILYLSYLSFQEFGPIFVKGFLLIVSISLLYFQGQRLGVRNEINLISIAIGIASIAPLISIRAENFAVLYFLLLTTILTASRRTGYLRYLGTLTVMAAWSNSHGSFALGFLLILTKCLVNIGTLLLYPRDGQTSNRATDGRAESKKEILYWMITAVACFIIMGFLNPYGIANLTMPFRQIGSHSWTNIVPFWAPLVKFDSSGQFVLYGGVYAIPFLVLVSAVILMIVVRLTIGGIQWSQFSSNDKADLLMHLTICLVVNGMAFFWGRSIVFAVGSLIPVMACLANAFVEDRYFESRLKAAHLLKSSYLILAVVPGVLIWFLFTYTFTAYFLDNPLRPNRPLEKRVLGSLPANMTKVADFLKINSLNGRFFSNMVLSDFLLLHVPDIKVFIDCRAQSMYSDHVLREYGLVMGVNDNDSDSLAKAVGVLEHYDVKVVTVERDANANRMIELLASTEKWRPAYVDFYAVVMVRNDSEFVQSFLKAKNLDHVRYPDETTRKVSEAFLRISLERSLPPAQVSELKRLTSNEPVSLVYNLLCAVGRNNVGCLTPETRKYFLSELERLSRMDYMRENGVPTILVSMIEIVSALRTDQSACRLPNLVDYALLNDALNKRFDQVRKTYLPWGALQFEQVN